MLNKHLDEIKTADYVTLDKKAQLVSISNADPEIKAILIEAINHRRIYLDENRHSALIEHSELTAGEFN